MSLSTNISRWRTRREVTRHYRDLAAVHKDTRTERHPVLAWKQLLIRRRWMIRALMASAAAGMVGVGIVIYLVTSDGSPLADYSPAGALAVCGGGLLAVIIHAVDTLLDHDVERLWRYALIEAMVLALALAGVLVACLNGEATGAELLAGISYVMVTAATVAAAWPISRLYRDAMRKASEKIESNGDH
ncbi:hypothetical protein ABZ540_35955 [Nocardia xishanensis]|uniref:hypothetical protein n=1 Tax=Nocardia xishanensis TaxID=238964 RepID=UPI0033D01D44